MSSEANTPHFLGSSCLNIDNDRRIALPADVKKKCAEYSINEFYITLHGLDECLSLYPFNKWQEVEAKLIKLPNLNPAYREIQRRMLGNATSVSFGDKGRFTIKSELTSLVGINVSDNRCRLMGVGEKLELWDESKAGEYMKNRVVFDDSLLDLDLNI